MAEGGALLRRYTGLNRYRGFESLSLRQTVHCEPARSPKLGERAAFSKGCSSKSAVFPMKMRRVPALVAFSGPISLGGKPEVRLLDALTNGKQRLTVSCDLPKSAYRTWQSDAMSHI